MTELRFENLVMPGAVLGPDSPLPPLRIARDLHADVVVDASIPEDIRRRIGYGKVKGCLPYGLQDQYDRKRRPLTFRSAVLENDILRATFLPEVGGRLWSLVHKPSNRELLYLNPVFQPGNLAIRNAWCSGGVEWNIGMIGHSPHTCSPMFTAQSRLEDGTPVLRLYEWERIRQVPYQIDAYLPDASPFLFVRVRIINPHETDCPMYWWSNMAVPEAPGTRILVPAESAYRLDYQTGLSESPIPRQLGTDISYPTNIEQCVDFFFNIREGNRPWIASLDRDGIGLVQSSTANLRGRKLFVWGMYRGGRHWQEFLSVPDRPYVEIQAGLAQTQSECLPMPAHAEWSWMEAYGLMQADPVRVHGDAWNTAWREVDSCLDRTLPPGLLDKELERSAAMAGRRTERIVSKGSGWGALDRRRRAKAGIAPLCGESMVFGDDSLGADQKPWLSLLETGRFLSQDPAATPGAWMVQDEWKSLLESAVKRSENDHWFAWLHLGVMRYYAGDVPGARAAWEHSLSLARSAWALRNLAVLAKQQDQPAEAADYWVEAQRLVPDQLQLASECGSILLKVNRPDQWIELLASMPQTLRGAGRMRYLEARARLARGEFDKTEAILMADLVMPDLQENESSLTDLWFDLQARRLAAKEGVAVDKALLERARREFPPPAHLEFRGQNK